MLFSSSEDLLDDDCTPEEGTPKSQSPLMLVSELRKSLTGLDRAVKTYSFMMNEDQVPVIQVEPPQSNHHHHRHHHHHHAERTFLLQQMSSQFSSLESEDESEPSSPYPKGGMDNFATGMIDTFETNLLKLKDFQTQSLPDVFEATKHFNDDDVSTDVSPLSSASVSTVSIVDSAELLDASQESPNGGLHSIYPVSPLAFNGCTSPGNKEEHSREGEEDETLSKVGEKRPQDVVTRRPKRVSSAGSYKTWESSSPVGSECSERDAPSPQPLGLERLKYPLLNGMGGTVNGAESPHPPMPMEEAAKRISRTSVTSDSSR